jgi:hypothetical protein
LPEIATLLWQIVKLSDSIKETVRLHVEFVPLFDCESERGNEISDEYFTDHIAGQRHAGGKQYCEYQYGGILQFRCKDHVLYLFFWLVILGYLEIRSSYLA